MATASVGLLVGLVGLVAALVGLAPKALTDCVQDCTSRGKPKWRDSRSNRGLHDFSYPTHHHQDSVRMTVATSNAIVHQRELRPRTSIRRRGLGRG